MGNLSRAWRKSLRFERLENRLALDAALSLEVLANSDRADSPPGPSVAIDAVVDWSYEVSNNGDQPVYGLELTDDRGTPLKVSDDIRPVAMLKNLDSSQLPSFGTLEATYDRLSVARFVLDPARPLVYASVSSSNSIAIINTDTLELEDTIFIGSNPQGMALSADGTRLYVANSTSNSVGVLDTATRKVLPSIPVQGTPRDIEVGADGRLYVLSSGVRQIDPTTGESLGPVFGGGSFLEISPNGDRVYVADAGLSPASLYQYDVTVNPPALLWESPHGGLSGSNGQDLAISHDGSFISYAAGAGQGGYRIAKYDTIDMSIEGTFDTGAYPREITFSPDDAVAYTVHTGREIDTWDTTTFAPLGTIRTVGEAAELIVDRSGRHVFAAFDGELRVYSTGRQRDFNIGDSDLDGMLDPAETWLFTSSGSAVAGQFANTVTATGTSAAGTKVTARDNSHYFGVGAVIDVQQSISGEDADLHPGPQLRSGNDILWQYVVTNRGSYSLDEVKLTDDNGTPGVDADDVTPTYIVGDTNQNGLLDPAENWHYELAAPANAGQHHHRANVTAVPINVDGSVVMDLLPVAAVDSSHYFGVVSNITIEVATNGEDADSPTGPEIGIGNRVTWAYQVSTTGNVPLANVSIVDDRGTPETADDFSPNYLDGDTNENDRLDLGEIWIYTASGVAVALQHANNGTVTASDSFEERVSDSDPSHHFGVGALVHVTTKIAGESADSGPGPLVASGEEVTWEYAVSNPGSYTLADITVSEDNGTPNNQTDDWSPSFIGGDVNGNSQLDPQEVWRYTHTAQAGQGQYAGQVTATGVATIATGTTAPDVLTVNGTDSTYYFGVASGVNVELHTNGQDADDAPGPNFEVGSVLTRTLVVSNTGNVPMTINSVSDTQEQPRITAAEIPSFSGGDVNSDGLLDVDEIWTYFIDARATALSHKNTAAVSAIDPLGRAVEDDDSTHYFGTGVRIALETQLNEDDADEAPGPVIASQEAVLISYEVTNFGSVALGGVELTDDNGTNDTADDFLLQAIEKDIGGDSILSPGESWQFQAVVETRRDEVKHTAFVSAIPVDDDGAAIPDRQPATDVDFHHYFGLVSAVDIQVSVNGQSADNPGVMVIPGDNIDLRYAVTNVGNSQLYGVSILDSNGTSEMGDDFEPTPDSIVDSTGIGRIGDLEHTFEELEVSRFVMHPTQPYLYASDRSQNSVAVINTQTLELEELVWIGASPSGMAISLDSSQLYVANASANEIGVLDLETRQVLPSIAVSDPPRDVEVGADGRLYVLGAGSLTQIDPTNGSTVGANIGARVYGGQLEISASRDRLYYADYGLSPASLYQFDITVEPPVLLWESPHGGLSGSNGQDLGISQDGSFISYAAGAGQGGYRIAKYDTSDMSIEGTFDTGAYPRDITFSPDGVIAYTVHTRGSIDVWNTSTFAPAGTISTSGEAYELVVDSSGRHLFAAFGDELRVYRTGRVSTKLNAGDINLNGAFDPGETWTFTASRIATHGVYNSAVTVAAVDQLGVFEQIEVASYVGAVSLGFQENISGAVVSSFAAPGTDFTLSDDRFHIVNGSLQLKDDSYLKSAKDDGQQLLVMSSAATPVVLQVFILNVASNKHPWQNADEPRDVNKDGTVSPIDVLMVINELNLSGSRDLQHRPATESKFFDSNGDDSLSPLDALIIINFLNSASISEGESAEIWPDDRTKDMALAQNVFDDESRFDFEDKPILTPQFKSKVGRATPSTSLSLASLNRHLVDSVLGSGLLKELGVLSCSFDDLV